MDGLMAGLSLTVRSVDLSCKEFSLLSKELQLSGRSFILFVSKIGF
jgi:hypothetical protein